MKKILLVILVSLLCIPPALAQADRREVRSGNRDFKKGEWAKAEIDYKKALLKDSTSVAAQYNLANALYREENYTEAERYSRAALDSLSRTPRAADAYYNAGDIYLQQRRWGEAVEAFKSSLRLNPGDMDAKSNLAYAQKMLEKEQQEQQQNQDQNQQNDPNQDQQNQDQNQDKNQDQDNDQNKDQDKNDDQNQQNQPDQNQDQDQNNNDRQQPQEQPQDQKISPEAAEQMLQAIQAQEDQTQEKVKKEKAAAVKSRQKEKNW